ncbi:Dimerisation domain-containing protein [Actinacidiphila yanglinensis]|uniref:Dimerisation domain-containing protein n=1 Tax=Actinacidiphila yanglinensis TaxID=310779 RepID=A0A1H6DQ14_9ACTN|nr:methyltransferase [Actinacidiphila yanglinensis]SEG87477.1 Dimerisation domain-containing protein [Actinacidiphila yanglinensis]
MSAPLPPPVRILQLATAGWMSQAVSAAAELGIADTLGDGPRTVEEIAEEVGAHAPTLYRLLRACADIELFEERPDRVFALTELGDALRSDSPVSLRDFAIWTGLPAERGAWTALAGSVRTGAPAFEGVHGSSVWDHIRRHPDVAGVFDRAMTQTSRQIIGSIVAAYDFGGLHTLVDVGGGRGALLSAILAANPGLHGVLYDQPEVVAEAGPVLKGAGVAERCTTEAGSFFDAVPRGGDAYLLSNIIHDWDDEPSIRILSTVRAALPAHGRVLLVEAVLPAGRPALNVKLMDLDMLVLCGGRQRTEAEFAALLEPAGMRLNRIVPGGHCSVVEAVAA